WQMPATWFQSVNPAFIFLLTWMVNPYWSWQARRGKEPSSVAKMAIGSGLLTVSYLVMALVAHQSQGGLASLWWLILSTGVLTLGEIYLSPVGLSLVTKVAPVRLVSMMMYSGCFRVFSGTTSQALSACSGIAGPKRAFSW
ncbi:MAG: hypothetical protein WCI05_16440, partial [Myxococcales bacterium]